MRIVVTTVLSILCTLTLCCCTKANGNTLATTSIKQSIEQLIDPFIGQSNELRQSQQASQQTSQQANQQQSQQQNQQQNQQASQQTNQQANQQTSQQANQQTSQQANQQTSQQANQQTSQQASQRQSQQTSQRQKLLKSQNVKDKVDTLSLCFVGDVMTGLNYGRIEWPVDSGLHLFEEVAPFLNSADVTFGNLEGSISNIGKPAKKCSNPSQCYLFRMPEELTSRLREAGFDAFSIANNHARDYGDIALKRTLEVLHSHNMVAAGQESLCKDVVFEIQGVRYGFIAFAPNTGSVDVRDIPSAVEMVKSLRTQCDILVVSMHAGAEGRGYTHTPRTTETFLGENRGCVYQFAHSMIDAGADVVFGHGPHVPRAIELYNGHFIAYSLGNFCTPFSVSLREVSGYAPAIRITIDRDGKFVKGRILSSIQFAQGQGPRLDNEHKAANLIRTLSLSDFPESPLVIDSIGQITRK